MSKAVILCTGDYGMDEEMLEKYCPWAIGVPKLMLDTVTGDGPKNGMGLARPSTIRPTVPCCILTVLMKPRSLIPAGRAAWRGNLPVCQ